MNIKDAFLSIIKPHEEDRLTPLNTVWGEQISKENVLPEYPRPQLWRDSFINLNGLWDYAITMDHKEPKSWEGQILVPFSSEASLSGVNRQLQPSEFLWYRKKLPVKASDILPRHRLILHFGAVDYQTEVFLNNEKILSHQGGYLPFQADLTDYLKPEGNLLLLKVQDTTEQNSQARGKQSLHRGGIFYTAQSGIWQTVWMEWVPSCHINELWFESDYDRREVTAHIDAITTNEIPSLTLCVKAKQEEIVRQALRLAKEFNDEETEYSTEQLHPLTATLSFTLSEEDFQSWSPEDPFLYDVSVSFGADQVSSYFAMRSYTIEQVNGKPVFCLNHKPYFLMGVLDQGYWPDGLYTAPSDEALLYDINTMKALGFNMLRKHIKVESARWYYHCDRLGMIVCQDMVNGGSLYHMPVISYLPTLFPNTHFSDSHSKLLSRKDEAAKTQWEKEVVETIQYLKFFPSIAIWVPFNEGWGQYDTVRITEMIRKYDASRLIDSASGWFDQNCGDFISKHIYFRPLTVSVKEWTNRAYFLSEYGGFACRIDQHSSVERVFGYKRYDTVEEFDLACQELIRDSLLPLREQGLSGAVFTQLSDVEEEVNGILTYDRKINKISKKFM